MRADGRQRWCSSCEKSVHDLSRYGEVEARLLLRKSDGLCVAYQVDRRGEICFRRTQLDRVGVALASLALSVSIGVVGALGFTGDAWAAERERGACESNPGCGGASQPERTPGEPFELPERDAAEPNDVGVTIFLGGVDDDDIEGESLIPMSVGVVSRLGGMPMFSTDLDPIREMVELTAKQAPQ